MIRPFTLLTMLLAAGSGAYLFAVKHHAQLLDDQIADISQSSRLDAQRIQVLQAQWALETDPTRLQQLAAQFTDLQPMQPAQLVTLAALKTSLPAPDSAPPGANPELPAAPSPDQPELDASAAGPGSDVAGLPFPPPPPPAGPYPVMMASALPSVVATGSFAVRTARRMSHSALATGELAEALPPPRPFNAPGAVAAAPAVPPPVYRNMPMGAQIVSVKASATVSQYMPPTPPMSGDNAGSALGLAANLPPPLPLPPSGDNN